METRICTKCKVEQSDFAFGVDNARPDKRKGICKTCCKAQVVNWASNNREHTREKANESYHRRKADVSVRRKELRELNPEKTEQDRVRMRLYHMANHEQIKLNSWKASGICFSFDEYRVMIEKQGFACAICHKPASEITRMLDVDHCHTTGRVRGLLCGGCNRAIGYLKDSITLVENALNYLRHDSESETISRI